MHFKLLFLLFLTLTTMLHAQVDSSDTGSSNHKLRGMRARISQEIKDSQAKEIRSTNDSIASWKINGANTESKYPLTDSLKSFFREKNKFSIGYLYNFDKSCKFDGHGLTIRLAGEKIGFETYLIHREYEDSTQRYFPVEGYNIALPSSENGTYTRSTPLLKQTTFGLNLLFVLRNGEKSSFYLTTGCGFQHKSKKNYSRKYTIDSHILKYLEAEKSEITTSNTRVFNIGLGASYNLTENFRLNGEVKLRGEYDKTTNYSPLPQLSLNYQF